MRRRPLAATMGWFVWLAMAAMPARGQNTWSTTVSLSADWSMELYHPRNHSGQWDRTWMLLTIRTAELLDHSYSLIKFGYPAPLDAVFAQSDHALYYCGSHRLNTARSRPADLATLPLSTTLPINMGPLDYFRLMNNATGGAYLLEWSFPDNYRSGTLIRVLLGSVLVANQICTDPVWQPISLHRSSPFANATVFGYGFTVSLGNIATTGTRWSTQQFRAQFNTSQSVMLMSTDTATGVNYAAREVVNVFPSTCRSNGVDSTLARLNMTLTVRIETQLVTGVGMHVWAVPFAANASELAAWAGLSPTVTSTVGNGWAVSGVRLSGWSSGARTSSNPSVTVPQWLDFTVSLSSVCRWPNAAGDQFLHNATKSETVTVRMSPARCVVTARNLPLFPSNWTEAASARVADWYRQLLRTGLNRTCTTDVSLTAMVTHSTRMRSTVTLQAGPSIRAIVSSAVTDWKPVNAADPNDAWDRREYITVAVGSYAFVPNAFVRVQIVARSVRLVLGNGVRVLTGIHSLGELFPALHYGSKRVTSARPGPVAWCLSRCSCDLFALHRRTLNFLIWRAMQSNVPSPANATSAPTGPGIIPRAFSAAAVEDSQWRVEADPPEQVGFDDGRRRSTRHRVVWQANVDPASSTAVHPMTARFEFTVSTRMYDRLAMAAANDTWLQCPEYSGSMPVPHYPTLAAAVPSTPTGSWKDALSYFATGSESDSATVEQSSAEVPRDSAGSAALRLTDRVVFGEVAKAAEWYASPWLWVPVWLLVYGNVWWWVFREALGSGKNKAM